MSNGNNLNPEEIEALIQAREELLARREARQSVVQNLETLVALQENASVADQVSDRDNFKAQFCDRYKQIRQKLLQRSDLAKLIFEVLKLTAPSGVDIVLAGQLTGKFLNKKLDQFCEGY